MGNARNIAFWVVLFLLVLALFNLFSGGQTTMQSGGRSYSDFVAAPLAGWTEGWTATLYPRFRWFVRDH